MRQDQNEHEEIGVRARPIGIGWSLAFNTIVYGPLVTDSPSVGGPVRWADLIYSAAAFTDEREVLRSLRWLWGAPSLPGVSGAVTCGAVCLLRTEAACPNPCDGPSTLDLPSWLARIREEACEGFSAWRRTMPPDRRRRLVEALADLLIADAQRRGGQQ